MLLQRNHALEISDPSAYMPTGEERLTWSLSAFPPSIWTTQTPPSTNRQLSSWVSFLPFSPSSSSSRCVMLLRSQHALQLASPGQVMTHSHFPEKEKGSNIASGDLIIYGPSVCLESLQRKRTKEHELWRVTFSSLLPFTSYMSQGKLTSVSLGFLICKLGIPFLLLSFWRIQ